MSRSWRRCSHWRHCCLSYLGIDPGFEGLAYYDRLFWGSGHIIQFSHTQLMLVAWLWLATVSGAYLRISPRIALLLFILGLQPVLAAPVIYLAFDVSSGNHLFWFIQLMKYGGAIAAVPIGVATVLAIMEKWRPSPGFEVERNALLFSVLLFGVGGGIGFMISGSTVTVPAHYHGSIVGVTIAFMGISYHLLPTAWLQPESQRQHCALATRHLRQRPVDAHHRPGLVRRLQCGAQIYRDRARNRTDCRHGFDGTRRLDFDRRRSHVFSAGLSGNEACRTFRAAAITGSIRRGRFCLPGQVVRDLIIGVGLVFSFALVRYRVELHHSLLVSLGYFLCHRSGHDFK